MAEHAPQSRAPRSGPRTTSTAPAKGAKKAGSWKGAKSTSTWKGAKADRLLEGRQARRPATAPDDPSGLGRPGPPGVA